MTDRTNSTNSSDRFLISEEHNATDHPVYRIIPLATDPAPPDVFPTREDAEQWIADWALMHGLGPPTDQTADQIDEQP